MLRKQTNKQKKQPTKNHNKTTNQNSHTHKNCRKTSFINSTSFEATCFIFHITAQKKLELSTNTGYKSTMQSVVDESSNTLIKTLPKDYEEKLAVKNWRTFFCFCSGWVFQELKWPCMNHKLLRSKKAEGGENPLLSI